jgi:hypothetical protein
VNATGILAEIDKEIARLTAARKLLANDSPEVPVKRGPGRPRGGKRKLSPEGRKRIADAMKKRWAERKKQSAKAAK